MSAARPNSPTAPRRGSTARRLALAFPASAAALAALAATASPGLAAPGRGHELRDKAPAALAAEAASAPDKTFRVIVQGGPKVDAHVRQAIAKRPGRSGVLTQFSSIPAVGAELTGAQLAELAADDSISAITRDEPVVATARPGRGQGQAASAASWRAAVGVDGYKSGRGAQIPTIAIVDSGIDSKVTGIKPLASVSFYSGTSPQSAGDGYGHGSFVAGLAASPGGPATGGNSGASPNAPVVALDVMSDDGEAWTSDLIRASDWILQNKDAYNIRVVNFSVQSSVPTTFLGDPLDAAVERLWLGGITVVAAAGNYTQDGVESGVPYAPANDPFVITVGAVDEQGTDTPADDTAAPWSAWGYTPDGFLKPDVGAPGRYMVGNIGDGTTLAKLHGPNKVGVNKTMLSGTSFAAPIVSGIVANLLAAHPTWTPDMVKGALMVSARPTAQANAQLGVGEVNLVAASAVSSPPNPNAALNAFVSAASDGSGVVFDSAAWASTAASNADWGSAAWGSAAWGSAAWGSAAWGSAAWSSAAWGSAAWGSAAWGSAAWGSAAWGSAAWGSAAWADNAADD